MEAASGGGTGHQSKSSLTEEVFTENVPVGTFWQFKNSLQEKINSFQGKQQNL
jgi:hypothetical protein